MGKLTKEQLDALHYRVVKYGHHAEAMSVAMMVVRHALEDEARLLDEELAKLGISQRDRGLLFDRLCETREELETQLTHPDAYERWRAMARTAGLLPHLKPDPKATPSPASASAEVQP